MVESRTFESVQFSHSVVSNSLWPHGLQHTGLPVHHQLPEFTQTHVHWVSDAIQPSHPLSSPSPPAFHLSQHQGLFQCISSSHHVAKVLELQHQSFWWIFRSDCFRIYWLDLLAVHGALKSLLQHHSSKASILWRSAFFTVQLSHPYMTTGKNITLTRWSINLLLFFWKAFKSTLHHFQESKDVCSLWKWQNFLMLFWNLCSIYLLQ